MCSMCSETAESLRIRGFQAWNTTSVPLEHMVDGTQKVFQNRRHFLGKHHSLTGGYQALPGADARGFSVT